VVAPADFTVVHQIKIVQVRAQTSRPRFSQHYLQVSKANNIQSDSFATPLKK